MGDKNKHIDDLFSDKLDKFELNSSPEEWSQLSSSLGKLNFFKFSFSTINAYVVGGAIALASTAGYVGINQFNNENTNDVIEDKIENLEEHPQINKQNAFVADSSTYVYQDSISELDIVENVDVDKVEPVESRVEKKVEVITDVKKNDSTKIEKPIADEVVKQNNQTNISENKDSLNHTSIDTVQPKKQRIVRRVKRKVIVKPKTVIIKDTVVMKK